jgi:ABC-type oligopeptide transport system substrate-binding subunit
VIQSTAVSQVEPLDGMLNKIGAKLNIQTGDFNFWIDNVQKENFDMTLMSDSGYAPAALINEFFRTNQPYANYGIGDAQLDAAIDAAVNAQTMDAMWKNLFQAMSLILQRVPGVMAWEDQYPYGARNNVHDVAFNESGYPFFYDAWLG